MSKHRVDTIEEFTLNAGVTVDGVLLKDNAVNSDVHNEKTAGAGVTVDGVLLKDGGAAITGVAGLISTGAAPIAGNLVLVAGTKTVNTTAIKATSIVILTRKSSGGTVGNVITYTIAAGVSFTVTSDNALDTSTFSWAIYDLI